MTKAEIRTLFTAKRKALSYDEYALLNNQLLAQFKAVDLSAVKYLHTFLPILSRQEPDTLPIISWLKEHYPQITIVYPRCDFAGCTMESFIDDASLQLAGNHLGITEPVKGNTIATDKIDMILLPLLAFDMRGYRVGYGKGFYDRFIASCRTDAQLLGLSFFDPVDVISDTDQYDKKMQLCLTPGKVWNF